MAWVKSNMMPLAVGAAIGYFIAKSGGLRGAASKAKATVS